MGRVYLLKRLRKYSLVDADDYLTPFLLYCLNIAAAYRSSVCPE